MKKRTQFIVRGLPKKTIALIDEIATAQGLSRNQYICKVLELVAKDQLILEVIDNQHIVINENTKALQSVQSLLVEIGGGEFE